MLAVECNRDLGELLMNRCRERFDRAGVTASFGLAEVVAGQSIITATRPANLSVPSLPP